MTATPGAAGDAPTRDDPTTDDTARGVRFCGMESALTRTRDPAAAVFQMARSAGLDAVELCLWREYESDPLWTIAGARTIATAAADAGVALPSMALIMLNDGGFAGDGATRRRARDIVRHSIDLAHAIGMRILLLPFFAGGKIETGEQVQQTIADAAAVAPHALSAGVQLGLETTLPAQTVVDVVRAVDSPAVRCYFDIGNSVRYGYNPVEEMALLHGAGALLPQMHVKDIREQINDVEPGHGRVPFPAVVETMRRIGYDGYLVFETAATPDPVAAARRHKAYLQGLLDAPAASHPAPHSPGGER